MKVDFNKLTKGVLIFLALLVAFSIFYHYVIFLPQKLEQKQKEYVAKRRLECYELYKERDRLESNVEGYFYREKGYGLFESDDVCVIRYKNLDWKESNPLEDKYFTKEY